MIKIFRSEIMWGMVAKVVNISSSVLLLPIVIHYLDKPQISLYILFISLGMITNLIDFGFNPTLMRYFGYIYAGSSEILEDRISEKRVANRVDKKLLLELFLTAKRIYLYLSIFSLIIFLVIESIYVAHVVSLAHMDVLHYLMAWWVFAFASVLNLYYMYITTLLQGRGDINLANKAIIISKLCYCFVTIILLFNHFQLMSVCAAVFVSAIVERFLCYRYLYDPEHQFLRSLNIKYDHTNFKRIFRLIWSNSYKLGLVFLSSYLILRSSTIIATSYLGLSGSASYNFTIQVVGILTTLAATAMQVHMPRLNQYAVSDRNNLLKLFSFSNNLSIILYLLAFIFLIMLGNDVLHLIRSNINLISRPQLVLAMIIYLLELQHSNFAFLITTDNNVPFIRSALLSGFGIVVFSVLLLKYTALGVWGILIAQGVVQLLFNNWYWIYYCCRKYKIGYMSLLRIGFKNVSSY